MKILLKSITVFTVFTVFMLSVASWAVEHVPDNSAINVRDDSVTEMTADNQSNNPSDVELTRKIRAELMSKKDLSTYAHNVKIIVMGKQVILKGPVRSKSEKATIGKIAKMMASGHKVQNEIEVTK